MVEGFDAADPRRISARAVRDEWTDPAAASGTQSRPLGGYGDLMASLARRAAAGNCRLHLHSVVTRVKWSHDHVEVSGVTRGDRYTVTAARAIVTLPLGVLQQGAARGVRFVPALTAKREALHALSGGAVLKVMMQFRAPFWEKVQRERFRDAAFFHAWRAPLRTVWTTVPLRSPLLTAWAGGPPALRLLRQGRPRQIGAALNSVQSIFGPRIDVRTELQNWWLHDWHHDPFARGAYSYVNVGGAGAREQLAAPLEDTLFFAGEATDHAGESGTVAAALGSGARAAQELIERTPG
jgi:monoamine oxidase